ncbi:hypothetical protein D3C85_1564840 [compost metagenome]
MCYCSELHGSLCDLTFPVALRECHPAYFHDGSDDPDASYPAAVDDYFQKYPYSQYALIAHPALRCLLDTDCGVHPERIHEGASA